MTKIKKLVKAIEDIEKLAKAIEVYLGEEEIISTTKRVHGVNCVKRVHCSRRGYLHASGDDSPYDVDGVLYCGRCHEVLSPGIVGGES